MTALHFNKIEIKYFHNFIENQIVNPVLYDLLREHCYRVAYDRWLLNTGLINMKYTVKGN